MAESDHVSVDFCSLGMFIIDEIHPLPSSTDQSPQFDIIGGAGTYAALGARLFSPPPLSYSIGWIVDAGTDFPPLLRSLISSWSTQVLVRDRPALTTRGWNGYTTPTNRSFKYLSPRLRLVPSDLPSDLLASKSFHLICSPERCIAQCEALRALRHDLDASLPRPIIVWEPFPDFCTPDELGSTLAALAHVDVVSPNHEELASLYDSPPGTHTPTIDRTLVENHARRLVDESTSHTNLAIVVRCAAEGVYVFSPSKQTQRWLPAYHTSSAKVIDPTGAGNGFLGGLAIGLIRTDQDLVEAARWGSVSAAFCVEQVGVPSLEPGSSRAAGEGNETWNGVRVAVRLSEYTRRTS